MTINISNLMAFYIVGAILLLAMVLLALPTLIHGPKDSPPRKAPTR